MLIIELNAAVDSAGTLQTLLVCNGTFGPTKPTDTPASTVFYKRIIDAGSIGLSTYSDGKTSGGSKLEVGEIQLANLDGKFDAWANYSFDGRQVVVRYGPDTQGNYPADYPVILQATADGIEATLAKFTVRIRDLQFSLQLPAQTARYGGTNALPNGLDGLATDLKGKVIRRIYGKVLSITPDLVNTSRLVYQLSDRLVNSVDAGYDRAAALTAGTARSLSLMNLGSQPFTFTVDATTDIATTTANTYTTADPVTVITTGTLPAPLAINTYYYWRAISTTTGTFHPTATDATNNTNKIDLTTTGTGTHTIDNNTTLASRYDWSFNSSGSYARLGSIPNGLVTFDITEGANAGARTVAQILKQLALDSGLAAGSISASDVTALDAANSAVVGTLIDSDSATFQSMMDEVAQSVGAWYAYDGTATLRMGVLTAPSGTPVLTLHNYDILKGFERRPLRDIGIPVYRVTVNHTKIWTVQDNDLAGSVSAATRAYLAVERRSEKAEDLTVKTQYLLARELVVDTLLTSSADAATEATRLLTLYKVPRAIYDVPISIAKFATSGLKMTDVVQVFYSRFGMNSGKLLRVLGYRTEFKKNQVILTLWG